MTSTIERRRGGVVKEQIFCILLDLRRHAFKFECYSPKMLNVIPIHSNPQKSIEYAQKKIRKNLNISLKKSTKDDSNAGNET